MSKVILTRYLYIYDECCLAFINSLLKKHDVKECYFWISEIYLSGFKIQSWQLLWFIYFDFYFINNPSFTSFIENKHNKNTFNDLLTVVKNLFKLVPNSKIFLTRQYNSQIKKVDFIFRGKKPKWLTDDYPPNYYALFRFLNKKLYHFAVSSLPNQIDDDLLVYIQKYFKVSDELFISLKNYCNSSYDNFDIRRAGTGNSNLPDLKEEFSDLPHDRGTLSMARSSDPNSGNSQFFICFKESSFLDRQYTVFGKVIEGMEFVDKIKRGEPASDPDKIISLKSL